MRKPSIRERGQSAGGQTIKSQRVATNPTTRSIYCVCCWYTDRKSQATTTTATTYRSYKIDRIMGDLKPGQKFPTPTPGFGDRVFYETLLRQRPESAMAQEW